MRPAPGDGDQPARAPVGQDERPQPGIERESEQVLAQDHRLPERAAAVRDSGVAVELFARRRIEAAEQRGEIGQPFEARPAMLAAVKGQIAQVERIRQDMAGQVHRQGHALGLARAQAGPSGGDCRTGASQLHELALGGVLELDILAALEQCAEPGGIGGNIVFRLEALRGEKRERGGDLPRRDEQVDVATDAQAKPRMNLKEKVIFL